MAIKYDGKSPSKLWYFWQKSKALVQTPFQYGTKKDAQVMGKNTGLFVGAAAVTTVLLKVPVIAALPLAPMLISLVGSAVAINYGFKAYQKAKILSNSAFVSSYVREKENDWLDRKSQGSFLSRKIKAVKDKIHGFTSKIPLPLVKAGKWLGIAAAVVGGVAATAAGLSYAGVPAFSTGATAAGVLGAVAHAGAVLGLTATAAVATATGLAVAAIPLGLLAAAACRKIGYARSADRPTFFKRPGAGAKPIDQGQVFAPKPAANDFGKSAAPVSAGPQLDDARRKAAEQRAANRARSGRGNRFT